MVNTKAVVLLIAASVIVTVVTGIAFAQYASAQANANGNVLGQMPQGNFGSYYPNPQQGYSPYGSAQNGNPYGYGMGMGMCGRFW